MKKKQNDVTVKWLGQMGLIIEIEDKTLCIDYYAAPDEGRLVPPPIAAEELRNVDVFLGTHDHIDHIDHKSWKIWAKTCPDAIFICPEAVKSTVIADGIDESRIVGLSDGASHSLGGVTIHAIAASHEFLDADPETGLYPYLQYIVEGCGVLIHHAGDTVRYEGMVKKLKDFGTFNLELLPINGRDAVRYKKNLIGNMTYQEAADVAGEVGTKLVIPGHWDMFADNPGDPEAFADYVDVKYGGQLKCKVPKIMEEVHI